MKDYDFFPNNRVSLHTIFQDTLIKKNLSLIPPFKTVNFYNYSAGIKWVHAVDFHALVICNAYSSACYQCKNNYEFKIHLNP